MGGDGRAVRVLCVQAKAVCLAYYGENRKVRYSISAAPCSVLINGEITLWEGRVSAYLEP